MLNFEFWSILEAVVNVLILFILLRIFLFKPINKIMNERTESIQKDIDDAEKAKRETEKLKQQYTDSINEAKEEANNILRKAHEDAEAERESIISKSHKEAEEIVKSADETIENERKRVIQQAHAQIADLAIETASKVIGANLDDEKNRKLVDDFLAQEEGGRL
ncbi:MAG: F0F1 ATP synthase subunit B [Ruminococcus sp.]|nr:F0F1 ATP synthase subunit B [Ruminococcus sp.]